MTDSELRVESQVGTKYLALGGFKNPENSRRT